MRALLWPVRVEVTLPVVTMPVGTGDVNMVVPVLALAAMPGNTGGGMAGDSAAQSIFVIPVICHCILQRQGLGSQDGQDICCKDSGAVSSLILNCLHCMAA